MRNIILIAPPAAGKGTISKLLVDEYNLTHISTGNILREVSKRNDEVGSYVRETLASGNLIDNEIVYKLLEERLEQDDCNNGYILDGFPRNKEQAIEYDEIIKRLNKKIDYVFLFDINKDILLKRVTGRRVCEDCGWIYNINFDKEQSNLDSICDKCHGRLYQRDDDNLASFEVRYQTYLEKSIPLIEYYENQNILFRVDSSVSKENTLEQIKTIISEKEMI